MRFRAKQAFTLLEMMISIVLLTIIFSYFYQGVNTMKQSTDFYEKKFDKIEDLKRYIGMLQRDLLLHVGRVDFFSVNDKNYTILSMQTQNSLYNIDVPYVVWYVDKEQNRLKRVESVKEFRLPIFEDFNLYFLDIVASGVNAFKLYHANESNNTLVYIDQDSFSPVVFEIPDIYASIEQNSTDIGE